ncbi:MAG: hypothetical protein MUO60_13990, partial [Clostridiaceae bacterium]|nr:hypothetical protein [Clostridiaceae bacterium]
MKKSTLFKKSVLIISLALVLGLFAGCTIIIPDTDQTGTVYLNITNSYWYYDIYLDSYSNYLGTTNVYGQKAFYNVPTGSRTFYAEDVDGWYSGQRTQYIQ